MSPSCVGRKGRKRPSAIAAFTRVKTSGRCSFSQAYCCALDMPYWKSGCSSSNDVIDDVVRATLRIVSRSGHSQAESMWAWPIAEMRCALASAGAASTSSS